MHNLETARMEMHDLENTRMENAQPGKLQKIYTPDDRKPHLENARMENDRKVTPQKMT